jgi:hypothetical protein
VFILSMNALESLYFRPHKTLQVIRRFLYLTRYFWGFSNLRKYNLLSGVKTQCNFEGQFLSKNVSYEAGNVISENLSFKLNFITEKNLDVE